MAEHAELVITSAVGMLLTGFLGYLLGWFRGHAFGVADERDRTAHSATRAEGE